MRKNLYLVHLSLHGLIRGHDLELGRDADTGGQTKYVLELVRNLAASDKVERVDLITRQIFDSKVSADYAEELEKIAPQGYIRRIAAGPRRYLKKESLWPYLDVFVDHTLQHFRQLRRMPDLIHAHYADAGYVGRQLANMLGCPFVFTGHSLGRLKRKRLLAQGQAADAIEKRYNLKQRIEAEELSLDAANLVCTSTSQEVDEQYALYDQYAKERMHVIPPGVDLDKFSAPSPKVAKSSIAAKVDRFLIDPDKPLILTLARADERKNLDALVHAYGNSPTLQKLANLVIIAGNRQKISKLDPGARKVWRKLLDAIDDHDLYGKVAYPKTHDAEEVPDLYRLAAHRRGVFVNPAITENFGLTLIEAAACGLPLVATQDGGPNDIISNCRNGRLIDPLDQDDIQLALLEILNDPELWQQRSTNGLKLVAEHYSWQAHVANYLDRAATALGPEETPSFLSFSSKNVLPVADRIIFTGLYGDHDQLDDTQINGLKDRLQSRSPRIAFGICTGRDYQHTQELINQFDLPRPDVVITQLGGEIRYGARQVSDQIWSKHLNYHWQPDLVNEVLAKFPELSIQADPGRQHRFKVSYLLDPNSKLSVSKVRKALRAAGLQTKVILTEGTLLDVLPLRSGKGLAIRYLTMKWNIEASKVLVFARHGNDAGALAGEHLAVLPADHSPELDVFLDHPNVFASSQKRFNALLDGIDHYQFDQFS